MPEITSDHSTTRPLTAADLPAIYKLIADIYTEYDFTLVLSDPAEHHLADPENYFRSTGGEFWVITDEHDSIFATVAVLIGSPETADAELKSMYVRKDHRRTGWARKLLNIAIDHARNKTCNRLFAWSDTRFTQAHALYLSAGFKPCGQRDIEDSNNSTELGFVLKL